MILRNFEKGNMKVLKKNKEKDFIEAVSECEYFTQVPTKNAPPETPMFKMPMLIGIQCPNGHRNIVIIDTPYWEEFQKEHENLMAEKFVPFEHLDE